jgi:hypothetical protein
MLPHDFIVWPLPFSKNQTAFQLSFIIITYHPDKNAALSFAPSLNQHHSPIIETRHVARLYDHCNQKNHRNPKISPCKFPILYFHHQSNYYAQPPAPAIGIKKPHNLSPAQ